MLCSCADDVQIMFVQVKELIAVAVGATIMMNALVAGYVHIDRLLFRNEPHIKHAVVF